MKLKTKASGAAGRSLASRAARSMLRIVLGVYGGLLLLLAWCQRSFIYLPRQASAEVLTKAAATEGLSRWNDDAGGWIGWRSTAAAPEARRVLVFHGNAGCAADRGYFAHAFAARAHGRPLATAILEYPGYGARPGTPGERAIISAAVAALDALLAERAEPVMLVGESLGTGVACQLAALRPQAVAGLLLITPFTSLADVGRYHYPWLPVRRLLRDQYDSVAALQRYHGRVVMVLAEGDEVVPTALGRTLYDGYDGPKRLVVHTGATHNTLDLDPAAEWWEDTWRFLDATE